MPTGYGDYLMHVLLHFARRRKGAEIFSETKTGRRSLARDSDEGGTFIHNCVVK